MKQKGVLNFLRHHKLDVIGLLETKLVEATLPKIMRTWFAGWKHTCNFHMHLAGRILVLWNPATVILEELDISPQVIHCAITCNVSSVSLLASFIYGYHTVGSRKPLWDNPISFGENCSLPWIAIGDYNNVFNANEKCNGKDVTSKELKDFEECCVLTGLTNLRSMGCYFTWTNNEVWCKLDRAMVNKHWLCKKLKNLKPPLKELNIKHLSHISSRAAKAKEDLQHGQLQLHDDPINVDLQNFVATMRKQSMTIEEFFVNGSLLKQINHTIIALVPKGHHAQSVGDYRPISCCNVFYKVITKIMAKRMAPLLENIVDLAQADFVGGRLMTENIHLGQELLRQYNRKKIYPRCLLKIDLRKLMTLLAGIFLRAVLEGLGFPSKFIHWGVE
ncbi:hypothetical protein DH2020_015785 [Rehmannia glutinosa]|uniref:Reverse transcriptase domain-containing protein n=1 Tax=Rehmannia glutinosa TaxID=99300 RepID=A0ABR0WTM3_REHGL